MYYRQALGFCSKLKPRIWSFCRTCYTQGQYNEKGHREYFYYIDHQGQLFLDDAKLKNFITCFKEQKFLDFFFKRIKENKSGRFEEHFPFLSPCGSEKNYVRCDDVPIVYNKLITEDDNGDTYLIYGAKLQHLFKPKELCMLRNGRLYHPASKRGGGIGLIKSSMAIELSQYFIYENQNSEYPSHFIWKDVTVPLTYNLYEEFNLKTKEM